VCHLVTSCYEGSLGVFSLSRFIASCYGILRSQVLGLVFMSHIVVTSEYNWLLSWLVTAPLLNRLVAVITLMGPFGSGPFWKVTAI